MGRLVGPEEFARGQRRGLTATFLAMGAAVVGLLSTGFAALAGMWSIWQAIWGVISGATLIITLVIWVVLTIADATYRKSRRVEAAARRLQG